MLKVYRGEREKGGKFSLMHCRFNTANRRNDLSIMFMLLSKYAEKQTFSKEEVLGEVLWNNKYLFVGNIRET